MPKIDANLNLIKNEPNQVVFVKGHDVRVVKELPCYIPDFSQESSLLGNGLCLRRFESCS